MSESTLLINQLPDDCLLKIFHLICHLPDLIHCYQVCQKWNRLIFLRARKAKYLLVGWSQLRTWKFSFAPEPKVPKDSIYYEGKFKFKEINLEDLFTKIKILDLFFLDSSDPGLKTLVNFINNSESLKGLICKRDMLHELSINCQHIEMLATDGLNDYYTNQGYGAKLSQLSLFEVVFTDFALNIKYFPKLYRLHLKTYSHDQRESNGPYSGPELKHLEILELLTWVGNLHVYYGFQFMDHCPSLKSAFITIEFVAEIFINKSILNHNLQDLVITFANGIDLKVLSSVLVKYPNIKHLGILLYGSARSKIKEHHVIELLNILPKLVVLDLTGSLLNKSAIEFIEQYCLKNHRQITLYDGRHRFVPKELRCYKRITEDSDFLRNVFFKNRKSYNLPLLMDQCFNLNNVQAQ